MSKEIININFNGKEYLEYKKYKDEKRKAFWTKENKYILLGFSSLVTLCFFITFWISQLTYKPSTFNFSWEGIAMFIAIAIGLGWIIHGVGFLLVRA